MHDSGVSLGPTDLAAEPSIEGEFAVTIAADVVPRDARPTRADVIGTVADVRPAIEIVGGRFSDFFHTPLTAIIADAGANNHLVLGPPAALADPDGLVSTAAVMTVDGVVAGQGSGADVLGDPLDALLWLVDRLSARGITLAQGQVVTTGTATQVSSLPRGATATNTLDGIGSVTVSRV